MGADLSHIRRVKSLKINELNFEKLFSIFLNSNKKNKLNIFNEEYKQIQKSKQLHNRQRTGRMVNEE